LLRLTLALGTVILAAVPIILGAWQIGTPNQAAGIVTIGVGVVLAMFLSVILVGYPGGVSGTSGSSID